MASRNPPRFVQFAQGRNRSPQSRRYRKSNVLLRKGSQPLPTTSPEIYRNESTGPTKQTEPERRTGGKAMAPWSKLGRQSTTTACRYSACRRVILRFFTDHEISAGRLQRKAFAAIIMRRKYKGSGTLPGNRQPLAGINSLICAPTLQHALGGALR